jgi:hypothetical protein
MDPLRDLYQSLGFLIATIWLYRYVRAKHTAFTNELASYRCDQLSTGERPHLDVKVVTDPRLGRLGINSIWCDHPGARCSCMTCRWNRKYQ